MKHLMTMICTMMTVTLLTWLPPSRADSIQRSENIGVEMTQAELEMAKAWELSVQEYRQSKQLQTQHQGLLSAEITPLEWLGIFAVSDAQRNHYAKLFAQRQLQTTTAILKFEAAYSDAIRTLSAKQKGTRLLLVTDFHCSHASCTQQLQNGLEHVEHGGTLDIYVQTSYSDADLRTWVVSNQIPRKEIRDGQITIRPAEGRMLAVKPGIYRVN